MNCNFLFAFMYVCLFFFSIGDFDNELANVFVRLHCLVRVDHLEHRRKVIALVNCGAQLAGAKQRLTMTPHTSNQIRFEIIRTS